MCVFVIERGTEMQKYRNEVCVCERENDEERDKVKVKERARGESEGGWSERIERAQGQ